MDTAPTQWLTKGYFNGATSLGSRSLILQPFPCSHKHVAKNQHEHIIATIKQLKPVPFTRVFRAIVGLLQHDPVLSSVIKPDNFRCWSGKPNDNIVFEFSNSPAIRITPHTGAEMWKFPTAFTGWLFLNVDMLIPGTDADDQMNLWGAIETAIYPDDFAKQQANVAALQAAGAYDGLCEFSQPAFDPTPSDRFFAATGQIKIQVLRQLTG